MPSTSTITAFYTFTADTRAYSAEVNYNFTNFRGHTLPVDPTTAAASHVAYDVGSSTYRWRVGYFKNVDLSATTTVSSIMAGLTTGGVELQIAGTSAFKVTDSGFAGYNANTFGATLTAAIGQVALSGEINTYVTTTGHILVGGTATISTNGRPVRVFLQRTAGGGYTPTCGWRTTTITGYEPRIDLSFAVNGTLASAPMRLARAFVNEASPAAVGHDLYSYISPEVFSTFLFLSAGTYNLSVHVAGVSTNAYAVLFETKLVAYELP